MTKCDTRERNEKCHYASDAPFECPHGLFIVSLPYIDRRCLLKKNFATILPLKSKLSGKFQSFNATDASIEMLKNS